MTSYPAGMGLCPCRLTRPDSLADGIEQRRVNEIIMSPEKYQNLAWHSADLFRRYGAIDVARLASLPQVSVGGLGGLVKWIVPAFPGRQTRDLRLSLVNFYLFCLISTVQT